MTRTVFDFSDRPDAQYRELTRDGSTNLAYGASAMLAPTRHLLATVEHRLTEQELSNSFTRESLLIEVMESLWIATNLPGKAALARASDDPRLWRLHAVDDKPEGEYLTRVEVELHVGTKTRLEGLSGWFQDRGIWDGGVKYNDILGTDWWSHLDGWWANSGRDLAHLMRLMQAAREMPRNPPSGPADSPQVANLASLLKEALDGKFLDYAEVLIAKGQTDMSVIRKMYSDGIPSEYAAELLN